MKQLNECLKALTITLWSYMRIVCLSGKMIFQFFNLLSVLLQLYFKLLNQNSEVARKK